MPLRDRYEAVTNTPPSTNAITMANRIQSRCIPLLLLDYGEDMHSQNESLSYLEKF